MLRYCVLILALIDLSISYNADSSFDVLIFTQHWPITVCAEWEESKTNNKCTLPPKENLWTIHGIWPTKIGTKGPNFCNNSWHFDLTTLNPILPDLELYWVNIEANTPLVSLWKHEWIKHGTCAASMPVFRNELDFFRKGLEWIQEYGMANILMKSSIIPRQNGYDVRDIYDAVKNNLEKNPIIECVIDRHTKLPLISEIRICFDKNLTLIDCDGVKGNFEGLHENVLTNCDLNKSIRYLDKVPSSKHLVDKFDYEYINRLYELYNFVQYLRWFTI